MKKNLIKRGSVFKKFNSKIQNNIIPNSPRNFQKRMRIQDQNRKNQPEDLPESSPQNTSPSQPTAAFHSIVKRSKKRFNKGVKKAEKMDKNHPGFRIIQRNVIYILGIKPEIAKESNKTSLKILYRY